MASEVTSDLNSELSGPNNLSSSAFLAPICFLEPFLSLFSGQNGHVDLRARTSPQVKIQEIEWHLSSKFLGKKRDL